jgi:hypothetical protein
MIFSEAEASCSELRQAIKVTTGVDIIGDVSVEKPVPPEDELHFVRLVAWTYVFLIEVAAVPIKHIQTILRGSNPRDHEKVATALRLVRSLRTYQSHQLSDGSKSDAATKKFVENWLLINQSEQSWALRAKIVCSSFCDALSAISQKWSELTADEEPPSAAAVELLSVVDRQWPVHLFDRMVEDVTMELGIQGLNCLMYRELKIEIWKKLAECFESREDAEIGLRKVIEADLQQTFGRALG